MMKPRNSRPIAESAPTRNSKTEPLQTNGPATAQQTSAQAIRKRRSSINVYDQPSSLNARLRQLETDMLRLDEDRTKLFDDTHASLAQFEIRLNEIQSILKSRQDNVEKYVEEMKSLIAAKEEFERQSKSLNEKHERMQDKFMHRETTISRDIKLLKTKFELLEKNRQFRSVLQSKSNEKAGDTSSLNDAASGLNGSGELEKKGDGASGPKIYSSDGLANSLGNDSLDGRNNNIGLNQPDQMGFFRRLLNSRFNPFRFMFSDESKFFSSRMKTGILRKSNRVSSVISVTKPTDDETINQQQEVSAKPIEQPT